ncbi:hypothetical protein A2V82_10485 [candidate division KSB1 bacterium RBG_16_48_16]|nr:MAG: hypothetical protein A2V82_10485 [candidate division KSB1 bacterium RBG_16_48_16]
MSLRIEKVNDKKSLKQFVRFPWKIYKNDPYWVPPIISQDLKFLNKSKGVFFASGEADYFLAFRDNEPVGRISAQVNFQYEKFHDSDTGFFGFFECINDQETADALFAAARDWLLAKKKSKMVGPMNFTIYDICGVLYKGFDSSPVILLAYNPDYYNALLTGGGFHKSIDWYAFMVNRDVKIKPSFYRIKDRIIRSNDLEMRTIDMKRLDREIKYIGEIFSDAWMENWGHVPLTDSQIRQLASELKPVVVPELTFLAFIKEKCVGFSLTIKDANPAIKKANGRLLPFGLVKILLELKNIKRLRTIAMGVLKEYRHRGIDIAFYVNTIEQGRKLKYEESECSIIVETNSRMIGALEDLQAKRYKTYRIYEKNLI